MTCTRFAWFCRGIYHVGTKKTSVLNERRCFETPVVLHLFEQRDGIMCAPRFARVDRIQVL